LFVAAAACLWGLWPLWVRLGGEGGARAGAAAFGVAGVLGLPIALAATLRRTAPAGARAWTGLVVLGTLDAANVWCYFRALAEGTVAPAVLSHYLAPVIIAAAAPVVLAEPRSARTPLALTLALGGTAALVLPAMGGGVASAAASRALLLGATSALFYAATTLVSKRLAGRFANSELMVYHAIVATALLVPVAGLPGRGDWGWLLAGGASSSLGGGLLFFAGRRLIPAERVGVLTYLEPMAAVLVGWIAFGETPSLVAAGGGVLILAAGLLVVTAPTPR